jgi:hypothetical protein
MVYQFLGQEDAALAQSGIPSAVDFSQYRKRVSELSDEAERSPLVRAHEYMLAHYSERGYQLASQDSAVKTIKLWFLRYWETGCTGDRTRAVAVGEDLSEDEWGFLKDCLVKFTWRDGANNPRRFPTLAGARAHFASKAEKNRDKEARARVQQLDQIFEKSKALGLRHLQGRVMEKFSLTAEKERFKSPREEAKAQHCAKRMDGQEVVLEYYRSTERKQASAHNCKKVKCLPRLPEHVAAEVGRDFGAAYEFWHEPYFLQLMGSLDGFRIDGTVPDSALGRVVVRCVSAILFLGVSTLMQAAVQKYSNQFGACSCTRALPKYTEQHILQCHVHLTSHAAALEHCLSTLSSTFCYAMSI